MKKNVLKKIMSILLSASLLPIPTIGLALDKDSTDDIKVNGVKVNLYNYNKENSYALERTVKNNKALDDQTEKALLRLVDMYDDNDYANYEQINNRFAKLTIEHKNKQDSKGGFSIIATYFIKDNKIVFYGESEEYILQHEVVHALYPCKNLPVYFGEGIASILSNEYFDSNPYTIDNTLYLSEMAAVKTLIELLGEDVVLKATSLDDPNIIINALTQIYGTYEEATERFNSLGEVGSKPYGKLGVYFSAKSKYGSDTYSDILKKYDKIFVGLEHSSWPKVYFNEEFEEKEQNQKDNNIKKVYGLK